MAVKICRFCHTVLGTRPPYTLAKTYESVCRKYACQEQERKRLAPRRLSLRIVVRRNDTWVEVT